MMTEDTEFCPGCGVLFQRDVPGAPGYLPEGKVPDGKTICQRCFRMRHYGTLKKASVKDRAIESGILEHMKSCSGLLIVLDISQLEVSSYGLKWAKDFKKPAFVVANKWDTVKNFISQDEMVKYMSDRFSLDEELIIPMAAKDRRMISDLRRKIEDNFRQGDEILITGTANVGKSTIASALALKDSPVASPLPGTTVGLIPLAGRDGKLLYLDSPGLGGSNPWLSRLCPNCLGNLSPKKKMKNTFTPMKSGQVMALGGFAHLELSDCGERGWIKAEAFVSEGVLVHVTNSEKIQKFLDPYRADIFSSPCPSCYKGLGGPDYPASEVALHVNQDLVVPGLGWIAVRSGNFSGRLYLPEGISPVVRPSLIPSQSIRRKNGRK